MAKDEEQDRRIGVLETDVAVLKNDFKNFEKVSEERHEVVKGTLNSTKTALEDFRREANERAERREKAEAERAAARLAADKDKWAILKDTKTQLILAAVVLAVLAPTSIPVLASTVASYFGAQNGVVRAIEDADAECCEGAPGAPGPEPVPTEPP